MRLKLPGVASSTKTLASGGRRTYFYAWRGGPMLKAADGTPLAPSDPAFFAAYSEAHAQRKAPAAGTFFNLIAEYRASSEFTRRSEKTRKDYRRYLAMIEEKFGTMPYAAIESRHSRRGFKAWRDSMAATPRTADYAWSVLARVLAVALDNGRISVNPCERGGRLYSADRADRIWTEADIAAFNSVASPPLQQALMLALWTGQRQGDLLRLSWTNYEAGRISLRQAKRRARVSIPVGAPLAAMLDEMRANRAPATTILTNTAGAPWTQDGFRTSWGKASAKAGITDLHFHDLRGTAITRLAIAECTTPEIASLTGHSLSDVDRILSENYLGGRVALSESAVRKLDAKHNSGT